MSSRKHTFIKSYPPIHIRIEVARHVLGVWSVTCALFLWFLVDLPIDLSAVDMPAVISTVDLSAVDTHTVVDTPAVDMPTDMSAADLPVDFSVNSEALMYKETLTWYLQI